MPVALITGGSAGLGRALTHSLADDGWTVMIDGRDPGRLEEMRRPGVVPVAGDVSDRAHRADLASGIEELGRLDLLVHNASTLGASPLRKWRETTPADLDRAWRVNVLAPIELTRLLLPHLRRDSGLLVSITSDAAVEHYETWGAYAATKAALEHATLTIGIEEGLRAYAVDPGDMRTGMHQDAFPGQDISDRPRPEDVLPGLRRLLWHRPESGRHRAADWADADVAVGG